MENKKPASKDVIIEGETFALYDVTVNDKQVYVASPRLYNKIDKCISNGLYHENICEMDGKICSIMDVNHSFQYVYIDSQNNIDPSEKEVIEYVLEAMESERQAEFDREFKRAVLNGNNQYLYWDKQTKQFHSLIETEPGSGKYISTNYTERIGDERLAQMCK